MDGSNESTYSTHQHLNHSHQQQQQQFTTLSSIVLEPQNCIYVSDAIKAQGIDDVTSWTIVQLIFGIVYAVLFTLGLVGNGGVLFAVFQNKRLRSARNIFLLNLILTDLLLCLTGVPVTPLYALSKDWRFGTLMCHLVPLSNSCAVFVTSWSLTAIALDKFMHIIDPTREPFSVRLAAIITILIWLICSLVNIPYLLSYELIDGSYYVAKNSKPFCGRFCDEIHWHGEIQRRIYGLTVMLFQFVIPMAIITYCYWRILNKVQKDMIIQNVQFSQSLTTSQRVDAVNRKKRVNYILIGMVLAFIGCWLPMTVINLAKDFIIAMSTVIWNPLLFFWLTRKQKRGHLTAFAYTSEIITSLASRMHSLRSTSNGSTNETRLKRRHNNEYSMDNNCPNSSTTTTNLIKQINNKNINNIRNNNRIAKHRASLAKMDNNGACLTTTTTNRPLNNIRKHHDRIQKTVSLSQMF